VENHSSVSSAAEIVLVIQFVVPLARNVQFHMDNHLARNVQFHMDNQMHLRVSVREG
jgi:hypothetical protein